MAKKQRSIVQPKRRRAVRVPRLAKSVELQMQQLFLHYAHQLEQATPAEAQIVLGGILVKVLSSLLRIVDTTTGFTAAERKAAVLRMVGAFYDQVFAPMIVAKFPLVGSRWLAPAGRELFIDAATGAIDALTDIFNRTGWGDDPVGTAATPSLPAGFIPY